MHPAAPAIASLDDLSGKTVHVRKVSSYYLSLSALNERFKKEGKRAINIVLVPDALEDEDMMEMVNAGVIGAIVVDDWKARAWAPVLAQWTWVPRASRLRANWSRYSERPED